ncbi:MAG TPA: hypothetical protein VLF66_20640 [Thermoanaerobaculia bacterium]|nr:hypothetical protein [Thermoanaerobaculia bacterium]
MTGPERLLLLRRGGGLWGVAHAAVAEVSRRGRGYRLRLIPAGEGGAGCELAADAVVGVADGVAVRPAGGVLAHYWSEAAGGLAVHGTTPLVVVDPERPPSFLRADRESEETEESDHGDGRPA